MKDKTAEDESTETMLITLEENTNDFLDELTSFKITSKETFDMAAVHLDSIGRIKKEIVEFWAPLIKDAFDTKASAAKSLRGVRDKEEAFLARSVKADLVFRKMRLDYKAKQDAIDKKAREKAEELAQKAAKKEADKLLKKAEKAVDPVQEEMLIEKADEVKVAPVFIPKTIKKSERSATGSLNTFTPVIEVEIHDVKSICGMIFRGDLPVNVVTVSEPKIKAWAKSFDKPKGMYDGFNINHTEKERITPGKR